MCCFTEHCISESLLLNGENVRYYGDFKNKRHSCQCVETDGAWHLLEEGVVAQEKRIGLL